MQSSIFDLYDIDNKKLVGWALERAFIKNRNEAIKFSEWIKEQTGKSLFFSDALKLYSKNHSVKISINTYSGKVNWIKVGDVKFLIKEIVPENYMKF